MELEKAKKGLKRFCEYEDSIVLIDNALYELQEMIETVLQALENSVSKDLIREQIERLNKQATIHKNQDILNIIAREKLMLLSLL